MHWSTLSSNGGERRILTLPTTRAREEFIARQSAAFFFVDHFLLRSYRTEFDRNDAVLRKHDLIVD